MGQKEHVLVTGGAGYIGSHTCKMLHKNGYTPVAYDNLSKGHESFVKWGPFVKGDIKNYNDLNDTFKQYNPVAVIHFAAHAYVGESVKDPEKYYENNIIGTLTLLKSMMFSNIKHIIFSSTCATYGIPERIPISEDFPQKPINPYGRSKLMIEQILDDYRKAFGIEYISLRYFNAAGADNDLDIGELHNPEPHLIPRVIKAAHDDSFELEIYGADYNTPDGTCIRDYIHVSDLAAAHLRALSFIRAQGKSDSINLGTGKGTSVLEIINMTEEISGLKVKYKFGEKRSGDPDHLVACSRKAEQLLNWKTEFSSLHNIIATAWEWYKKIHNRKS